MNTHAFSPGSDKRKKPQERQTVGAATCRKKRASSPADQSADEAQENAHTGVAFANIIAEKVARVNRNEVIL